MRGACAFLATNVDVDAAASRDTLTATASTGWRIVVASVGLYGSRAV